MNELVKVARPKGFKSLALAGIFFNTFSLAILYPVLIYFGYKNPEEIAILRTMSLLALYISLPLTSILLVGSIGLLFKQYWSRLLCLWTLTTGIIFGVCEIVVYTLVRVANWDENTIIELALLPIYILNYIVNGVIIFYLSRKKVEQYLKKYRDSANG